MPTFFAKQCSAPSNRRNCRFAVVSPTADPPSLCAASGRPASRRLEPKVFGSGNKDKRSWRTEGREQHTFFPGPLARLSRKRLSLSFFGHDPIVDYAAANRLVTSQIRSVAGIKPWDPGFPCPCDQTSTDSTPCRLFPPRLAPMPRMCRAHPTRLRRVWRFAPS